MFVVHQCPAQLRAGQQTPGAAASMKDNAAVLRADIGYHTRGLSYGPYQT